MEKKYKMIIPDCGHVICDECLRKLYNIDKLCGTTSNLISYSVYQKHFIPKCPMCRKMMPIHLNDDQIIKCS